MLSTVKKALRIKTDAYDDELETYIAAALYDLDRLNIAYNEDDPEPEVKTAVVVYVKSQHRFYQIKEMKEIQESEESYYVASSVFPGSPSFNDETTSLAKEKTVFIKDNTEPYIFEPQVGLKSLSRSGEGDSGLVWK